MFRVHCWGIRLAIAVLTTAGALALAPAASAAPATAPAAGAAGEALSAKGLTKVGTVYVLAGEKDVIDGMRPLAATKAKFDQDAKARAVLERQEQQIKGFIAEADYRRRDLNQKLATVTDATQNNHLVAQINILSSQIKEAEDAKEQNEKKLSGLGEQTREAYINQVLELSGKADAVVKQYADLAADPDVKAALAAARGKLGPSEAFTSATGRLKVMRGTFSSDTITVKHEGGVPMVEVTINGKTTRSMVLDSGASLVSIPADLAKELGLAPDANTPVIHLQLADGKVVEARQMTLKSVRVGTFTVEDVDCAVLPADLITAEPLLGGSFLKNFIYKLDPQASELHMARVGGTEDKPGPKAGPGGKPGAKPAPGGPGGAAGPGGAPAPGPGRKPVPEMQNGK